MTDLTRIGIDLDEHGRPVGFGVGKEAAMRESIARRERREFAALVQRFKRAPTRIDWASVPLGTDTDTAIAARIGVAPSVVLKARNRLGIPPHSTPHRPWTRDEDARVRKVYASHGWARLAGLATELGRTPAACKARAVTLGLCKRRARDRERWPRSLHSLSTEWGYHRRSIQIAAGRLGIELTKGRGRRVGDYRITREQAARILSELARHPDGGRLHRRRPGEWAPGESCVGCGRDSVLRHARERCQRCYQRAKRPAVVT